MQTQSSEILRKIPRATAYKVGTNGKCPVCGGNGSVLYERTVEGYEDFAPLTYATPCTACQAGRRAADNTGVPIEFRGLKISDFDFEAYDVNVEKLKQISMNFIDRFAFWQSQAKGLYLWSRTPGSGKSFLASVLAQDVSVKGDLSLRFVTAADYLACVGESYKMERGQTDPSAVYRSVELLILDDIGAQKAGEWQSQELFGLIDGRLNEGKLTLFTSNLAPDLLKLDARLVSRIKKASIALQMPECSIRDKNSEAEKNEFLRQALKQ